MILPIRMLKNKFILDRKEKILSSHMNINLYQLLVLRNG